MKTIIMAGVLVIFGLVVINALLSHTPLQPHLKKGRYVKVTYGGGGAQYLGPYHYTAIPMIETTARLMPGVLSASLHIQR